MDTIFINHFSIDSSKNKNQSSKWSFPFSFLKSETAFDWVSSSKSTGRDKRTVDAIEMFILGCLWCGCPTTFWGLARSIVAVGSSGGICGLFGYSIYQNWDNHRRQMSLLLISDIIRWMDKAFGLSIPYYFTFGMVYYIWTALQSNNTGSIGSTTLECNLWFWVRPH